MTQNSCMKGGLAGTSSIVGELSCGRLKANLECWCPWQFGNMARPTIWPGGGLLTNCTGGTVPPKLLMEDSCMLSCTLGM